MSTTATICLAAACLILIVRVTNAWEAKPCDGFKRELISLDVHNCPNKTAEYCEIKMGDEINWDVEYIAGVSYDKAVTGSNVPKALGSYKNHCKADQSFCPGRAGKKSGYNFQLPLHFKVPSVYEKFQLYTRAVQNYDDNPKKWGDYVVCAEIPVKFVE